MCKYRIILPLLMTILMVTAAHSQESQGIHQSRIVLGTVTSMDFVGNTLSIVTGEGHQISFYVPGNAVIIQDTHDIGLMDVKVGHTVTIKYDTSSSGKATVDNIVDNKLEADEASGE